MTPLTTPLLRIAVIGPITGGSLSIAAAASRALSRLGHDVRFIDNSHHAPSLAELKTKGLTENVRRLAEVDVFMNAAQETHTRVAAHKPQLALYLAQAPVLSPAHLGDLHRHNVPTVFWFVEDFRVFTYWQRAAPRYDHVWAIQGQPFLSLLKQKGIRHVDEVPLACEPPETSDWPPGFLAGELTFVGTGYPNRVQFFQDLAQPSLRLYGPGYAKHQALRPWVQADGVLPHEQLGEIFAQSRINLNLSSTVDPARFDEPKDFVNPRTFEICAAGGFQLAEDLIPLHEHFDVGNELVTFTSLKDARDKIDYYLRHEPERQAIALRGQRRAIADHSYDARLTAALARLMQVDGDRVLAVTW